MRAIVDGFVRTHAVHHTVCRVSQYELHALTPEHYRVITGLRRRTTQVVRTIVDAGVASGHHFTLAFISRNLSTGWW